MRKRALSERECWESGMNPSLYSVCDREGTFTGVIDSKKWGKKCNLLVYVTLDNDEKIFASVWAYNPSKVEYLDMDKVPVGSKVALTFVKGKSGVPYLREFEVLYTPDEYEYGDDDDDY